LDAATVSLHAWVGRKRITRKAACVGAARPKSVQFSLPATPTHEWEAVQEMLSVSRPSFIPLAYSVLRNKEDAEDAVQDAMLSAYRNLRSFEGRSSFTAWFARIVVNAALMILRKRKPARIEAIPISDENNETSWIERVPAPQPDPEMTFAETETFRSLDELLPKMSPVLRQAFTMAYCGELYVEEAGALLSVTAGTLKSRVFRARQFLIKRTQRSLAAPIRYAISTRPYPKTLLKSRLHKLRSDD
jgi:RNA polymerase sigma-70 factor, ECF subfamily